LPLSRLLVIFLLFALLGSLALQRCAGERPQQVSRSRILMGTVVEISAFGRNKRWKEQRADDAALAREMTKNDLSRTHKYSKPGSPSTQPQKWI
jgi:hypothetical protein